MIPPRTSRERDAVWTLMDEGKTAAPTFPESVGGRSEKCDIRRLGVPFSRYSLYRLGTALHPAESASFSSQNRRSPSAVSIFVLV